jgi:D-glycero-alpha-D-manno-heptose-7-phosphate kinase
MPGKPNKFIKEIKLIRACTPLRLSFGGGGTDVSPYADERGGCVVSSTISLYVYATLVPTKASSIQVRSLDYDSMVQYSKEEDFDYNGQMDLAKGVFRRFGAHKMEKSGFDLYVHGDAPPGSGLGSSSTFTVTLIGLFREWLGIPITTYDVAEMAYEIERHDIGIKGGKQDQYAAAFGGFNFIEFLGPKVVVTPLRLSSFLIQELEYNLLLCYTGGVRESQHLISKQIDNFQAGKKDVISALDEIKAIALEIKQALLLGDLDRFGHLLHEGWEQKKQTASGISSDYIDQLYYAARSEGAIGGKLAGAGGGGYLLLFVPFHKKHKVTKCLTELGGQVINFRFSHTGMSTWRVYS